MQVRQLTAPPTAQSHDVAKGSQRSQAALNPGPTVQVSVTLPVALYERLMHKAHQEDTEEATLVRQAIERYLPE